MQLPEFKRQKVYTLGQRLQEQQPFIQVVLGPRQVGKTTAVLQVKESWGRASIYESADSPAPPGTDWIEQAWQAAEYKTAAEGPVLLILDEIQKVQGWAECIKALWEQRNSLNQIRLVLCGSSSLQIQGGLTESLAGRFELIRMSHWSFVEMEKCFQWDLDTYLYYGGYPGAARLRDDWTRWGDYVQQSLVETAIGKDILLMHRVQKPALLRRLYALSCDYAGQIISYQKLLGQLQDAGNTTTLAHYQHLLEGAYLVQGLQKWHGTKIRTRSSSPKWQPRNTALVTSQSGLAPADWRAEAKMWGRLVEIAVGAYLVNQGEEEGVEVYYWREKNREVDFVLKKGNRLAAIEVKSGQFSKAHSGVGAFQKHWP
ncbi:ATP-binding protein, partial [Desulfonatronospira sp. MSAO_Bac3]|uniref:ATP-binding protein n=1 Tax=Desulfonatronospira sp. MSAO_Bac3 TaxID=2293857 RepID=UPI000FF16A29